MPVHRPLKEGEWVGWIEDTEEYIQRTKRLLEFHEEELGDILEEVTEERFKEAILEPRFVHMSESAWFPSGAELEMYTSLSKSAKRPWGCQPARQKHLDNAITSEVEQNINNKRPWVIQIRPSFKCETSTRKKPWHGLANGEKFFNYEEELFDSPIEICLSNWDDRIWSQQKLEKVTFLVEDSEGGVTNYYRMVYPGRNLRIFYIFMNMIYEGYTEEGGDMSAAWIPIHMIYSSLMADENIIPFSILNKLLEGEEYENIDLFKEHWDREAWRTYHERKQYPHLMAISNLEKDLAVLQAHQEHNYDSIRDGDN